MLEKRKKNWEIYFWQFYLLILLLAVTKSEKKQNKNESKRVGRGMKCCYLFGRDWRGRRRPKQSEQPDASQGSECKVPYQLWFVFASAPLVFSDIQHPPWRRRGGTASVPTLPAGAGQPPVTQVTLCKKNSSRLRPAEICAMVLSSWDSFFFILSLFPGRPFTLLYTQVLLFPLVFFPLMIMWDIVFFFFFRWLWLISKNKLNCQ